MRGATEGPEPISRAALWFTFLGGPVAWTIRLLSSYPLVSVSCRLETTLYLNLITAATAAIGLAAMATGWIAYRRVRDGGPSGLGDAFARARFMALSGIMISGIFTYAILNEGMAAVLHDPCLRAL